MIRDIYKQGRYKYTIAGATNGDIGDKGDEDDDHQQYSHILTTRKKNYDEALEEPPR